MNNVLVSCNNEYFLADYTKIFCELIGRTNVVDCNDVNALKKNINDSEIYYNIILLDNIMINKLDVAELIKLDIYLKSCIIIIVNSSIVYEFKNKDNLIQFESYVAPLQIRDSIISYIQTRKLIDYSTITRTREFQVADKIVRKIDESPEIRKSLNLIAMRYDNDQSIAGKIFVDKSAKIDPKILKYGGQIPEPMPISDALNKLITFMKSAEGKMAGELVIGEKAIGKTTLTCQAYNNANLESSNLFLRVDLQWVPFYEIDGRAKAFLEEFKKVSDKNQKTKDISERSKDAVLNKNWDQYDEVSFEIQQRLIGLMRDPVYAVNLYAFIKKQEGNQIDNNKEEIIDSEEFETWCNNIRHNSPEFLTYVVDFFLNWTVSNNINKFFVDGLLSAISCYAKNDDRIKSTLDEYNIYNDDVTEIKLLKIMKTLKNNYGLKFIVFWDNIDIRAQYNIPEFLIEKCISFTQALAKECLIDVIICMRNTTYKDHWVRKILQMPTAFNVIHLLPPDLTSVIIKRLQFIKQSGYGVGDDSWFITDHLNKWVKHLERKKESQFIRVITMRHPTNVRGQLDLFVLSIRSLILHANSINENLFEGRTVSQWFAIRALMWGKLFFNEDSQTFAPNIYDNRTPNSPFNAILRYMILDWIDTRSKNGSSFKQEEIKSLFEDVGIPKIEIERCLSSYCAFDIIRSTEAITPDLENIAEYTLTTWGQYFYDSVCTSLAYFQSLWWATHIQKGFSIGEPRILQVKDLKTPVENFVRWIDYEDRLVEGRISSDKMNKLCKTRLSMRVSQDGYHALNEINCMNDNDD